MPMPTEFGGDGGGAGGDGGELVLDTDVLVVGAGPTGLLLAALLAQRGVSVIVLERRTQPSAHSRAIGLHPPAVAALAAVGLEEDAVAAGVQVQTGVGVSDGRTLGELRFDHPGAQRSSILVLPQNQTEQLLAERVEQLAPGAVWRGMEVIGLEQDPAAGTAQLTVRTADGTERRPTARMVVGADGTHSTVRALAGIPVTARDWPDRYLMGDFPDTTDHGSDARIHLHAHGVVESFPLPVGMRRWVVHTGHELLPEDPFLLAELVHARTGERIDPAEATMVSAFSVRRQLAQTMVSGQTVLIGDAAHAVSPIGGQGMTLGWQDAVELAPLMAAPPDQRPDLTEFSVRRLRTARIAARQAEVNMVLGRALPRPARVARDLAARAVLASPLQRTLAWTYAMGWAGEPRHPRGVAVVETGTNVDPMPTEPAAQPSQPTSPDASQVSVQPDGGSLASPVARGERGAQVSSMFNGMADRYDLMNLVMTWGQEPRLVRRTVERAELPDAPRVLDLATGTGDIALEILRSRYAAEVVGADFAPEMMEIGRRRPGGDRIQWVEADAMDLPFEDESFDAVTHGYLLRNVEDIPRTLAEQFRVLKPGGRMVALETSPAPKNVTRPFSTAYIQHVVPLMGRLITQNPDAYEYLSSTTRAFKTPAEIAGLLEDAGFVDVGHELHMFGTLAIHWAVKPGGAQAGQEG
ncbi:ubiquinone/menaquinone biosynthesis methyltransferase [Micrococcus sp. IITD107]|uniref:ubiquinone/menaquinone biosynthesis methyltransferase n=1 Tax=Micrococcus sp. IITD107 TaxID=3342790 RepID=UPI0035B8CB44